MKPFDAPDVSNQNVKLVGVDVIKVKVLLNITELFCSILARSC